MFIISTTKNQKEEITIIPNIEIVVINSFALIIINLHKH